jgi:hypothetical protein
MARGIGIVAVALMLTLLPGRAVADHGIESAVGGGRTVPCVPGFICLAGSISFAAQDGPSGPRGSYHRLIRTETGTSVNLRGEVDCLLVVGNTATISGDIVQESTGAGIERFMIIAVDNGPPEQGTATDAVTEHFFTAGSVTDPVTCLTTGSGGGSVAPLMGGNITVHDDV